MLYKTGIGPTRRANKNLSAHMSNEVAGFIKRKPDGDFTSGEGENWLRGLDLNQRPSGYEPDELPGCSTPRSYYDGASDEIKLKSFRRTTILTAKIWLQR